MKLSTGILVIMLFALVAGLLLSNIILKREYDKMDKSDIYWTYGKILNEPFKYLKIEGGNITNIAFEQSSNCSVRILNEWQRSGRELVKAFVKSDTLFVKFLYNSNDMGEKSWMKRMTLVRIFSPELLYVDGFDTKFEMFKVKQKSFHVNMHGRSTFEVESMIPGLDTIIVSGKDSSEIVFEMSPEYKRPAINVNGAREPMSTGVEAKVLINASESGEIKSTEAMTIQSVQAKLQGYTLLDIGHAQIKSLQLNIADSSAIILSGGALKKISKLAN